MDVIELQEEHVQILARIRNVYADLFYHQGFGSFSVEMRFLKKGQKEIIVNCGKEYRYVVDYPPDHGGAACPGEK